MKTGRKRLKKGLFLLLLPPGSVIAAERPEAPAAFPG